MQKDNIILLSHTYSNTTPSYGNRDMFKVTANSSISSGGTANSSCWIFTNNHIGTHIDVPYHFDINGAKVTDIPPSEWLFNNVAMVDVPCNEAKLIDVADIEFFSLDPNIEMLLIRTIYEKYRDTDKYWKDNPGLSPDVADYLRKKFPKLRCIGFDFISITSWKHRLLGRESHKAFLMPENNAMPIMAIEDMSLKKLNGKIDWIIVAPILVEDGNGAPVTVFANMI
jgi:kynurenine formamidase